MCSDQRRQSSSYRLQSLASHPAALGSALHEGLAVDPRIDPRELFAGPAGPSDWAAVLPLPVDVAGSTLPNMTGGSQGQHWAAGWYPDPETPGLVRWWDGQGWAAPVNKKNTPLQTLAIVAAVIAAAIVAVMVLTWIDSGKKVVFSLAGTARGATVDYSADNSGSEQRHVSVPWSHSVSAKSGATLVMTAQNDGAGSMTCVITVDGREVARHTSHGRFAVVTCSGNA